jgi:hypothetical protein
LDGHAFVPEQRLHRLEEQTHLIMSLAQSVTSVPETVPVSRQAEGIGKMRVCAAWEEIEKLRPYWSEWSVHPDADIDFYSFHVHTTREVEAPFVIVLELENKPTALLLGRIESTLIHIRAGYFKLFSIKARQLTILGDGPTGILGASDREIARLFFSKLRVLLASSKADRIALSRIPIGSELFCLAGREPSLFCRDHARHVGPHWAMSIPESFDAFLKLASSKRRWWMRHILKEIDKAYEGTVKLRVFQTQSDIESFCMDAERVAAKTYQRGLGVGFMNSKENHDLLRLSADLGCLRSYVLYANDRPIAFWSGARYKNVWYSNWTGFDPDFESHNPGTVLLLKMVQDMCACGIRGFDFGIGHAEYKQRFGNANRDEALVCVYAASFRGLGINLAMALQAVLNRSAKSLLAKLKITARIKRFWRMRLTKPRVESERKD